jgi:hypothetical protein
MSTAKISLVLGSTDYSVPLGAELWIDDHCFYNTDHITAPTPVCHEIHDTTGEHELKIVLKNKRPEYTNVDDQGNLTKDAVLTASAICFDDIDCSQLVFDLSTYTHNFNGSQGETTDQFYGSMGCNGTVSLKFSTPFYLWLLENM